VNSELHVASAQERAGESAFEEGSFGRSFPSPHVIAYVQVPEVLGFLMRAVEHASTLDTRCSAR
jgi:hypothetical protein